MLIPFDRSLDLILLVQTFSPAVRRALCMVALEKKMHNINFGNMAKAKIDGITMLKRANNNVSAKNCHIFLPPKMGQEGVC